jgi:FAD:protein FMN transferase
MKPFMGRRAFLQGLGILGAGWALDSWARPLTTTPFSTSLVQVSETRNLMGTFVTITIFHPSGQQAQTALGTAFQRMENLIQMFTRHETSSPVSCLNERGFLNDPPPEFCTVLRRSMAIHSRTLGAFDITIKPVLDLYEAEKALGRLPVPEAIQVALSRVGAAEVRISPDSIVFQREGMGITLDGIAKGTIVDKTITFLQEKGIRHALVAASGDIRVIGGRSDGVPWRIAVYDPTKETKSSETIFLQAGAISTSGSYMVYFDQEKIHHHILSPQSGASPPWSVSTTVIAPLAEEADALATALMILSPEEGLSLINRDNRLAAMCITKEGKKGHSLRWPHYNKMPKGRNDHV